MIKIVPVGVGTLLTLGSFFVPFNVASAATTPTSHSGQIVHSMAEFNSLIQESMAGNSIDTSSAAKDANIAVQQAAETILGTTHSRDQWANYLAQHGQIVFVPSSSSTTSLTPDSQPNEVTIDTPSESYDPSSGEATISGYYTWNSLSYAKADFPNSGSTVGGLDYMGLQFSHLPDPSNVVYKHAEAYNSLSAGDWSSSTWTTKLESGGQFLAEFGGQDDKVTNSKGATDYSWYSGVVTLTFASGWSDTGQCDFTYSHDWDQTGVSGFSFGATGSEESGLGFGFNVDFNNAYYNWAANSGYLNY